MVKVYPFLASILAACALSTADAQITYVDADTSTNTFDTAMGSVNSSWYVNGTQDSATKWGLRSGYANSGTILEGRSASGGDSPLTTQLSGLSDGSYDVWVFFWDASGANTWQITAGLSGDSLATYSADGAGDTTDPVNAATLDFTTTILAAESDRIMYGVNLGQALVSGGSSINVRIEQLGSNSAGRTWYDGVGYVMLQDSDGDGLSDGYEQSIIDADPDDSVTGFADVMGTGAAPAVTDFDNDGSNDAEELINGTDPLDSDSDNDTLRVRWGSVCIC